MDFNGNQWKSQVVAEGTNQIKQCGDDFYVSASDGHPISLEAVNAYEKQMKKCDWKVFAEFADCAFGLWKITLKSDSNETNYKNGTCTCPTYFKQFICKHIIGIAIVKNMSNVMYVPKMFR